MEVVKCVSRGKLLALFAGHHTEKRRSVLVGFVRSCGGIAPEEAARTRLGLSPVVFYAGLFVCIDIAYNVVEREELAHREATVARCPYRLRDRDAGRNRRAGRWLQSDVRGSAPRLAAGAMRSPAVKVLHGLHGSYGDGSNPLQNLNPNEASQIDDDIANRL